jgi:hypothetical protein
MIRMLLCTLLSGSLLASTTFCCCVVASPQAAPAEKPCCCCTHEEDNSGPATPTQPKKAPCHCKHKHPQALASQVGVSQFEAQAIPAIDLSLPAPIRVTLAHSPESIALPSGWFADSQAILRALRMLRL